MNRSNPDYHFSFARDDIGTNRSRDAWITSASYGPPSKKQKPAPPQAVQFSKSSFTSKSLEFKNISQMTVEHIPGVKRLPNGAVSSKAKVCKLWIRRVIFLLVRGGSGIDQFATRLKQIFDDDEIDEILSDEQTLRTINRAFELNERDGINHQLIDGFLPKEKSKDKSKSAIRGQSDSSVAAQYGRGAASFNQRKPSIFSALLDEMRPIEYNYFPSSMPLVNQQGRRSNIPSLVEPIQTKALYSSSYIDFDKMKSYEESKQFNSDNSTSTSCDPMFYGTTSPNKQFQPLAGIGTLPSPTQHQVANSGVKRPFDYYGDKAFDYGDLIKDDDEDSSSDEDGLPLEMALGKAKQKSLESGQEKTNSAPENVNIVLPDVDYSTISQSEIMALLPPKQLSILRRGDMGDVVLSFDEIIALRHLLIAFHEKSKQGKTLLSLYVSKLGKQCVQSLLDEELRHQLSLPVDWESQIIGNTPLLITPQTPFMSDGMMPRSTAMLRGPFGMMRPFRGFSGPIRPPRGLFGLRPPPPQMMAPMFGVSGLSPRGMPMSPNAKHVFTDDQSSGAVPVPPVVFEIVEKYKNGEHLNSPDISFLRTCLVRTMEANRNPLTIVSFYSMILDEVTLGRVINASIYSKLIANAEAHNVPQHEVEKCFSGQPCYFSQFALYPESTLTGAGTNIRRREAERIDRENQKEDPSEYTLDDIPGVHYTDGKPVANKRVRKWIMSVIYVLGKKGIDETKFLDKMATYFGQEVIDNIRNAPSGQKMYERIMMSQR